MDDEDELPDRFFRERRLLLGVSIILLAHQLLGITVGKGTETLGLHFDIEDPSRLWWALWAVWTWAIVCYVQQLNALKPRTKYPKDRDEEARVWLSDRIVLLSVRRHALKHHRDKIGKELSPRFGFVRAGRQVSNIPGAESIMYAVVSVTARWKTADRSLLEARARAFDAYMEAAGWRVPGGGISIEGSESEFHRMVQVRVLPIQKGLIIRVAARLWTLLSTPFLTDYFAPLAVGIAPLIVSGVATLLLVCGGAHAAEPSANSNDQRKIADNTPAAAKVSVAGELKRGANQSEQGGDGEQKHWWDNTAVTNDLLALFTAGLVVVGVGQICIYRRQARIMQTAIEAPRRPRLAVREVMLFPITNGPTLKLRCVIANTGNQEGLIVESHFEVQSVDHGALMPLQPIEGANPIGPINLGPGEHKFWEVGSTVGDATLLNIANAQTHQSQNLVTNLYFRGFLTLLRQK
jgi:hypothetical protein